MKTSHSNKKDEQRHRTEGHFRVKGQNRSSQVSHGGTHLSARYQRFKVDGFWACEGWLGVQCQARVCAYRVGGESSRGFTEEGTFGSSILQSCDVHTGELQ